MFFDTVMHEDVDICEYLMRILDIPSPVQVQAHQLGPHGSTSCCTRSIIYFSTSWLLVTLSFIPPQHLVSD